ncbi:MAG: FG-GAP repeat protein, partial [Fimbriimonadales bacterium]|nr:FG-GAP repeat protein [Fimbriimonadales bacterium]
MDRGFFWVAGWLRAFSVLGVVVLSWLSGVAFAKAAAVGAWADAVSLDAASKAAVVAQIAADREARAYAVRALSGRQGVEGPGFASEGFEARNDYQGYRVRWQSEGWVDVELMRGAVGRIRLRTEALGRPGWMVPVLRQAGWSLSAEVEAALVAARVEQRVERMLGPGQREWWRHGPQGAQHWLWLQERPAGLGPLEVELALEAPGYRVAVEAGRLVLANERGAVYFEGLKAWDVRGVPLQVSFVYQGGRLAYRVEDAQAQYPLTIDPTLAQQAYIKASNTGAGDEFGTRVALSADGNTLAVGARLEDSNATGVNGNQSNNSASDSGAVYIFTRSGSTWSQQAYIKASNTEAFDNFGYSVALSADGNTLAVGAPGEDSNATGVNGNQLDNSASASGAVYIFTRSGSTWSQQAYLKASNTEAGDGFGFSVALSGDGNTLAVGSRFEDSNATGVNGNQWDNSAINSGAVYIFTRSGITWSQQAYIK